MMQTLIIIQNISLAVMLTALVALSFVVSRLMMDQEKEIKAAATIAALASPAPFHPTKGHRKPCADVGKCIITYRYLNEGRTMQQIAGYFGIPVSSLQKLLDKHGRTARREMEAEV